MTGDSWRSALLLGVVVGYALGRLTSPEVVRRIRWKLEKMAAGDHSADAADKAREDRAEWQRSGKLRTSA